MMKRLFVYYFVLASCIFACLFSGMPSFAQRDQQAIDDAVKGWWTVSMKDHDQRTAWWKEARFGMFIHWGIYSLPGGEWKGKTVKGYAEHLMRIEKIPRQEYLELAHHFNPEKFDARRWASYAKKAGMKYLIITSKHHDGFAMFDSKVSDYNIMQQTPYKKDPMAALAAACKAEGIKFGFYYSHAFDWEHPDAPGNDWDYDNPGGDKGLHGGASWFDLHPELLPKAQHYVDTKAIPQIRELIRKYHPDILWFDTPSKLPLSENIRILKAIREADSHVVVNGRLARSGTVNYGDYKNTADRPAEFYPVEGDWEAIPTTNESYGYHQSDKSHKPVGFFIQLLAKAASRGGNLLMNIGPKGDGTFDTPDLAILQGIGQWMDKNGKSIYGTQAGILPFQNWGVSTSRGKTTYLHVFSWPADGKLYVGGLKTRPKTVYLLADPAKAFTCSQTEDGFMVDVPAHAPDTANTVLAMEFTANPEADTVMSISPNIPLTRLLAFDATQHGKSFGYGDGKRDRFYVDGWKKTDQYLSWTFRTSSPASYLMEIRYIAGNGGGKYTWQADGASGVLETLTGKTAPLSQAVSFYLPAGVHEVSIKPLEIRGEELMKLLELRLMADKPGTVNQYPIDLQKVFSDAENQTGVMLKEITGPGSPRTLENGKLKMVASKDWTSGFFPGVLWMLYENSGKNFWKEAAASYTSNLEQEKTNGGTHDMGFKIYCSFGKGYGLTKDPHYKEVILQAAKTLSTRFNPKVGCIRSWDHHKNLWGFPVIIDNMMNLELLFAATRLSGDSSFYKIAVSHANTTMKNHYRPDYSSFHVVDYDTATGKVVRKMTWQGFSDSSAWSRGQAWGLYAFTMCYRETGDKAYLKQAERIASFILQHPNLPKDKVPYWDFNAPGIHPGDDAASTEPRDASAATVIASGLYELSRYSRQSDSYRAAADIIMKNLTDHYRAAPGEAKGFILLHSTGAKPSNSEVDVPLCYADYYYLEALQRGQAKIAE